MFTSKWLASKSSGTAARSQKTLSNELTALTLAPNTSIQRIDRTDTRSSGSSVSSLTKRFQKKTLHPASRRESTKFVSDRSAVLPMISVPQTPEDWRNFYSERAAIGEHDGGLSRAAAEQQAYEICVAAWLNSNPDITENIDCVGCGEPVDDNCLPVLTGTEGRTWVHDRCHSKWSAERREQAERAIREILDHHAGRGLRRAVTAPRGA